MARHNATALVPRDANAEDDPANDVARHDAEASVPNYVLTAAQRRGLTAQALALAAAKVPRKLATHVDDRLAWLGALQASAWRDQRELAQVSFGAGPITRDEIDALGLRIEFAREAVAARGVSAPRERAGKGPLAAMSDEAIKGEVRAIQGRLCDALVPRLRSADLADDAGAREKRRAVQRVRRDRAENDLAGHDERLFALCGDPETAAWLRTLPKGEHDALERLRVLHPEWVRRAKHRRAGGSPSELALRAWALVLASVPRLVTAGRYLVKGDPSREGDYKAFRSRKARAPKPASKPPAP